MHFRHVFFGVEWPCRKRIMRIAKQGIMPEWRGGLFFEFKGPFSKRNFAMCRCLKYLLIFMTACLLSATSSQAADRTWTEFGGHEFTSRRKLDPGGRSLPTDDYYINVVGATCPILTTLTRPPRSENCKSARILASAGKLIINGSMLTANDEVAIGGVPTRPTPAIWT